MQRIRRSFKKLLSRHPVVVYMVVFVDVFFYSMVMTMVFPFLPHLVRSFGVSELQTGTAVGAIGSSLYLGRLLFSMFWGYLADTLGKKRSLMITMMSLLVATILFGFCDGTYWATSTRFLQGCSMGHVIILKAILADVCDDSNLAWGLGVISNSYSTGFIIGPSITGFLAFPAEQHPGIFSEEGVFGKFVILLPITVTVAGLIFGIVCSALFLADDAKVVKKKRNNESQNISGQCYQSTSVNASYFVKESQYFDYIDLNVIDRSADKGCKKINGENSVLPATPSATLCSKIKNSKIISVLRVKEFRSSCFIYGSFSALDIGFLELFPTLAATSFTYKGLNFSTSQIGTVMMSASFILVPVEFFLLPKLNDRYGSKKVLIGTTLLLSALCPMLPLTAAIRSKIALWMAVILLIFLFRTCLYTGYLSINILINSSIHHSLLGCANGLGGASQNIGMLIAPIGFGRLYSWSLVNIQEVSGNLNPLGFPFNQFLCYFILSLWAIFIAVVASLLPERMNCRKARTKLVKSFPSMEGNGSL